MEVKIGVGNVITEHCLRAKDTASSEDTSGIPVEKISVIGGGKALAHGRCRGRAQPGSPEHSDSGSRIPDL